MGGEDRDNRAGDLVLNGEHVLELPFVALGPAMDAGHRVNELHRYANSTSAAANASLQDVVHAKLASDLAYVDRLSLVLQRGVVGDDEQLGETRQLRNDVLGNAVRKIVLFSVAAGVVQGQHCDRGPVG